MPTPGSSPNGWSNRLRLDAAHNQFPPFSQPSVSGFTSGAGTRAGLAGAPKIG
jgi:hypothetical protein